MDITLIATADWDHPFWTNKQHVACSLADCGHCVLYVESLGLRPPRLEKTDLHRIFKRLIRGLSPPRQVKERIWVVSPLLYPAARWTWQQILNRCLLSLSLRFWHLCLGMRPELLWTYNPLTLQVVNVSRFQRLVYHCVDDLTAQPCMPSSQIKTWEELLCRKSDVVFVTSRELERTRGLYNSRTYYFSNVADDAHFMTARGGVLPLPADLAALPEPRLGFVGAISSYKIDVALVRQLALHRSDASIVLIGRVGEGDPFTDLDDLLNLPNVHLLGPRPYAQLPSYLSGFDVALIPAPINAYTRSMFPMKFFEYLSAGVPVVATELPALADYASWAQLCGSVPSFIASVDRVLEQGRTRYAEVVHLPAIFTYRGRTEAMLRILSKSI